MDAQQQEQQAFERAFAETSGTELPASTAEQVAEAVAEPEPKQEPEAPEASTAEPEKPEPAATTEEQPAQPEAKPEDDDPILLDGLKRSELHRLLGNAADVENLKKQLAKAHGNIGDMNRKLQQFMQPPPAASPAPTPAPAALLEPTPEQLQLQKDFPEIVQLVRSLVPQQQAIQSAPAPQPEPQPAASPEAAAPAPAAVDPAAFELALMDRMHKGWREKMATQDFNVWVASQGEKVQSQLDAAASADDLIAVIGQYDQWASGRQAAADKSAKGQQRLQKATTPSGNAPKPQAAPTEQEAMEAAFNRIIGR